MSFTNKKILFINFSGRKSKGNCISLIDYMVENIKPKDYDVISIKDLSIKPCINCDYECFDDKECINKDDELHSVFVNSLNFDVIINVVPIYCGNLSSLYQIYNERSQYYYMNDSYCERQSKIKKIHIVVGNISPSLVYRLTGTKKRTFIASPHSYNLKSISGSLLTSKDFIKDFNEFLNNI